MPDATPNKLVDHFFRHESGKLIATLSRFFGLRNIQLVEDMVQSALVDALHVWKIKGVPNQPAAWIHRVAKNKIIDSLRRDKSFRNHAERTLEVELESNESSLDHLFDEDRIQDDLLRMIFACCHPALPAESSVPLALKTICGFSGQEIANGLLLTPENVRKRIYRAKQTMIDGQVSMELPAVDQLAERLHVVHNVLYLMFNEGYGSSGHQDAIRLDVCEEAARLCHLLTEQPSCSTRTTKALLALMLFHASRFQARIDDHGALVLLEDQNRSLWDRRLMGRAMEYLNESSRDQQLSTYHFEAAIAMYHCRAANFDQTNWSAIVALYDRLLETGPSSIYEMNRAVAVGQRDGPAQAIKTLKRLESDSQLKRFHLLDAALGDQFRRSGNFGQAQRYYRSAIEKTDSPHDKALLRRQLAKCE